MKEEKLTIAPTQKKVSAADIVQRRKVKDVCEQGLKMFEGLRQTSNDSIIAVLDDVENYIMRQFVDGEVKISGEVLENVLEDMYNYVDGITRDRLEKVLSSPDTPITHLQQKLSIHLNDRLINFKISDAMSKTKS